MEAVLKGNQALGDQGNQLAANVIALQAQLDQLRALQLPPFTPPRWKCPVASPEKFDGSHDWFPSLLAQWILYMDLHSEDFPDGQTRVEFLYNLLMGPAAEWATPYLSAIQPSSHHPPGFSGTAACSLGGLPES